VCYWEEASSSAAEYRFRDLVARLQILVPSDWSSHEETSSTNRLAHRSSLGTQTAQNTTSASTFPPMPSPLISPHGDKGFRELPPVSPGRKDEGQTAMTRTKENIWLLHSESDSSRGRRAA
jgi:hypothetical protein